MMIEDIDGFLTEIGISDQRDIFIIKHLYLDRDKSRKEIANFFGVSRQRIYQLEERLFKKLRHPSRRNILKQIIELDNQVTKFWKKKELIK